MTDLLRLGKSQLRKMIPTDVTSILTGLDQLGVLNTGFNPQIPVEPPQKSYMWEVEFRDPRGKGETVSLYAKLTAIPASMSENIKRWYAGVEYSYSGRDTSPRVFRVTFWDNQSLENFKFFQYWYDCMNEGKENRKVNPEHYLRNIFLKLKDSSDIQVTNTIEFFDCYPTEIGDVSLSYGESTEFTFDVMFTFRRKGFNR